MTARAIITIAIAAGLWAGLGCSDGPTLLDPCEYGTSESCFCGHSETGTRQCSTDRTFGDCQCPDEPDMSMESGDVTVSPACISIEPSGIGFGLVPVGGAADREVTISNCSPTETLEITSIRTCLDDGASCEPTTVFDADGEPMTLAPAESAVVNATYRPPAVESHYGRLDVRASTGEESIELTGQGDTCPAVVAEARLADATSWATEVSALPLNTLELRANEILVMGGSVARYEWSVTRRPAGSTATFVPGADVPDPTLFLDLAGEYSIELKLFDGADSQVCSTGIVEVNALPDKDIHIQLVWDTPADADQTDGSGTDVDLHFLHPNGVWNTAPFDIFYLNRSADWGAPGRTDDPSLDIDDTSGAGPENINLRGPEDGTIYSVGAFYFAERTLGVSNATIRIYVRGVQQFEQIGVPLMATGDFWLAATIEWPSANIVQMDQVTSGFPPP